MTGMPILEVAIGLAFTYLLLALICTTITEWIARLRDSRARMLEAGIRQLLGEGHLPPTIRERVTSLVKKPPPAPGVTDELYAHPLIKNLAPTGKQPSYVDAKTFALALKDVMESQKGQVPFRAKVEGPGEQVRFTGGAQKTFLSLRNASTGDYGVAQLEIERWYESAMERVSGWYKRHTQSVVLALSVIVVVATNADTLAMTKTLWRNPSLRAKMVEGAKARAQRERPLETVEYSDPTSATPTEPVTESTHDPNSLTAEEEALMGQILGWAPERDKLDGLIGSGASLDWLWLLRKLMGLGISALAVSLGAPFWFDTLNRFMNIRSSGARPDEAKK